MVGENWSFLCGVSQDLEADIIIGLLNEENIPTIKQYPDAGGFLKIAYGLTTGVDLFVPNESRNAALQLIQASMSASVDNEDELEENEKEAEEVQEASLSTALPTSHAFLWVVFFVAILFMALVYNSHIF